MGVQEFIGGETGRIDKGKETCRGQQEWELSIISYLPVTNYVGGYNDSEK